MRSLSIAGDYQILGRCNDLDGVQLFAARRLTDADHLFALHHFPRATPSAEQELRAMAARSRTLDDPILVMPREVVRTEDGIFVVTDFFGGESLEQIVKNHRAAIPKLLAICIARDLARALDRARERTGRGMVGDLSSGQIVVSYESGELKAVSIGVSLLQGRAPMPATRAIGLILWEMLVGRKPSGELTPPKAGTDLDRIVMRAIDQRPTDDLVLLAEDLNDYVRSRTTGIDRANELAKLMRQCFSHKATAMRALVQRWRSQSVVPRTPSMTTPPPRRVSSLRPQVVRREAALSEPLAEIIILPPEELAPTDDLSSIALRPPKRGWPRMRMAFFMLLLLSALVLTGVVMENGDGGWIVHTWRTLFLALQRSL